MAVDAAVIKATQESLGPFVKKPPLTEKLLGKPFTLTFVKDINLCVSNKVIHLSVSNKDIYMHIYLFRQTSFSLPP